MASFKQRFGLLGVLGLLCPDATAQTGPNCEWGFQYTSRSGTVRMYRTLDLPVYATGEIELRISVGGTSPYTKELRVAVASNNPGPLAAQSIDLVFGDGRRMSLSDPRIERGPESDAKGRKWECAWAYFQVPAEPWAALGSTGLKTLTVHDVQGSNEVRMAYTTAEEVIDAVACVNSVLPPSLARAEAPEQVEPQRSTANAPKLVVSPVPSDTLGTTMNEPVFQPPTISSGVVDPVFCMVQRLIAVPSDKVRLLASQRSVMAVLHAFSDPMELDTFKIITTTAKPPSHVLEIVSHGGVLLFKEEILPSGFDQTEPGLEERQLELDRLRSEAILGPWSFGRPMDMELYRLFIDRANNGTTFEVTEAEVLALLADPGAVTFSYYADPDQRRVLTYSRSTSRLVNLVPLYP